MQHLTDDRPMACIDPTLPSLTALGVVHAGELVRAALRAGWIVVVLVALPGILS